VANNSVLLLGSYGQTNIGDDLLMFNYLDYLHKHEFGDIYVNASRKENVPAVIQEFFPGLKILETYQASVWQWIRIIRKIDLVVYGGGTIYKELYASTGRSKYSVITRILIFNTIAFVLRKQIINLHIGIGSIRTGIGKLIIQTGLRLCSFTIFRDKTSYEYARKTLKLNQAKICHATDGLFMNSRWSQPRQSVALNTPAGSHAGLVGVNLVSDIPDWIDRQEYIETLVVFLNQLLDDGYFLLLMPFQHDFNPTNDHAFMQEHILPHLRNTNRYRLLASIPIEMVSAYFRAINFFIGMRFHSLLLATVNQTPFLGIAYDTKCWRFIEESGYSHALQLENLAPDRLKDLFVSLVKEAQAAKIKTEQMAISNYKQAPVCLNKIKF
jgi:polysaccharide pyruvyl transferase WcaK-like protein